jgi:hypothetical protein
MRPQSNPALLLTNAGDFGSVHCADALSSGSSVEKGYGIWMIGPGPTQLDFAILDGLGYLPFAQAGGQLHFHLISRLQDRVSRLHAD